MNTDRSLHYKNRTSTLHIHVLRVKSDIQKPSKLINTDCLEF